MRVHLRRLLAPVALVVLLGACRATATLTVRMHADGSGVVSVRVALDAAAVRAAEVGGGTLGDRVRLTDLTAAGWSVTPWHKVRHGGATLTVEKPFTRPEQVGPIVRELNGPNGPYRGFRATRDASTFTTWWRTSGVVDLRRVDLGIAADPQLVANLANEHVDLAGVEARVAEGARDLRVRARVELPDGSNEVVTASAGHAAPVVASADDTATGRIALVVLGVVVAGLAVWLLVVGETRARRRRARRSVRSGP